MSYSFSVRAGSKGDAQRQVNAKLDEVMVQQPIHEIDRFRAQAAVEEFLIAIGEPAEGMELALSVTGSVTSIDGAVTGVGISISISHQRPLAD